MADSGKHKKQAAPVASGVKTFLISIFLGANLVTLVLLWVCCASTWVNPAYHPHVGVIGLAFPVLVLLNLLFIPFWLLFKFRMLVLPVVGMALCGHYILDYCPLNLGGGDKQGGMLTVLSWNTHSLGHFPDMGTDSIEASVAYLVEQDADIYCLQELSVSWANFQKLQDAMQARGYYVARDGGLGVVSRYPILSAQKLEMESRAANTCYACDVLADGDTLTVVSCHLECNRFQADEIDEYASVLHDPNRGRVKSEVKYLREKLAVACRYRALQTQALTAYLDALPEGRSVLLCGDFNDTPVSYAYQQVGKRLDNAFRMAGRGTGYSYRERIFPVRIDHIFASHDWQGVSAKIDRSNTLSDHYPVVVRLRKR